MTTKQQLMRLLLVAGIPLAGCSSLNDGLEMSVDNPQGSLSLNLVSEIAFIEETRALNEHDYKNVANYTVQLFDKTNTERFNCKQSELIQNLPIVLPIGSCRVVASYGKEEAASRSTFFVSGEWNGVIKSDKEETVDIVCTPTCGRVSVAFAKEMSTYFSDYKVEFAGTEALGTQSISWLKTDTEPWYVKLNAGGETINFTITANTLEDYVSTDDKPLVSTRKGSFSLSRNKAYKMVISPAYTPTGAGQVGLEISIDESVIDREETIEVPITWI